MEAIQWKSIRVTAATRKRLTDFIESLRRAREQGKYEGAGRHVVDITLDDAINALLDREEAKKQRAVESKARTRKAKQASQTPEPAGEEEQVDVRTLDPEPPAEEDEEGVEVTIRPGYREGDGTLVV